MQVRKRPLIGMSLYNPHHEKIIPAFSWTDPGSRRGGGGGMGSRPPPPAPEKLQNIGFLCNTVSDPLKTKKLPSQHSMLGHHRPASETPFQWRFTGWPR